MTSRRQPANRAAPRLYLVTQQTEDAAALVHALEQALGGADVAAVLLRAATAGAASLAASAKRVAALVQGSGVALLLDTDAATVIEAGADGAHTTGFAALQTALPSLKPAHIAGVGGLLTRHDAMLAGEAGADYLMFGEPDAAGRRLEFEHVIERVAWWNEIAQVPCVGFAATPEEAAALAAAGAEFVAFDDMIWRDARGPAAAVTAAAARLRALE